MLYIFSRYARHDNVMVIVCECTTNADKAYHDLVALQTAHRDREFMIAAKRPTVATFQPM